MKTKKLLVLALALTLPLTSAGKCVYAQENETVPPAAAETTADLSANAAAALEQVQTTPAAESDPEPSQDAGIATASLDPLATEVPTKEHEEHSDVVIPTVGMETTIAPIMTPAASSTVTTTAAPAKSHEPTKSPTAAPKLNVPHTNAQDVELQTKPDRSADVIVKLNEGVVVEVLGSVINGSKEMWYVVKFGNDEGYILSDFIDNAGNVPDLTLTDEFTAPTPTPTEEAVPTTPEPEQTESAEGAPSDEGAVPSVEPQFTAVPTASTEPTQSPTDEPSDTAEPAPTDEISADPSVAPDAAPSAEPSITPDAEPTVDPSVAPDAVPTIDPSNAPDTEPTVDPGMVPTTAPDGNAVVHTVTYFDFEGNVLSTEELADGTVAEEKVFEGIQDNNFGGWFVCAADGTLTDAVHYEFGSPIESDLNLRAQHAAAPEPTEVPSQPEGAQPTEAPAEIERKVTIAMECNTEVLELGSQITLTATLEGYEGVSYTCRWQFAEADAEGNVISDWQDAQAEALSISYILNEENLLTAWRMCVTVVEPMEAVDDEPIEAPMEAVNDEPIEPPMEAVNDIPKEVSTEAPDMTAQ